MSLLQWFREYRSNYDLLKMCHQNNNEFALIKKIN